jgi:hypothetical protein
VPRSRGDSRARDQLSGPVKAFSVELAQKIWEGSLDGQGSEGDEMRRKCLTVLLGALAARCLCGVALAYEGAVGICVCIG